MINVLLKDKLVIPFDLKKINNIIILIRLLIFYFILILVYFTNQFKVYLNELIGLALFIAFISLIIFILNYTINNKYLLIFQSIIDVIIVSYLIYNTNFLDSPYIIFFAFIIGYLAFVFGFKIGLLGLIEFILSTLLIYLIYSLKSNINFSYLLNQFQYLFAFIIIYLLTSYLHYQYSKRVREYEELHDIHEVIVKNIGIGIILLDEQNRVVSCNDAGKKILSLDDKIIGKKLDDIFVNLELDEDIISFNDKFIGYKLQDFRDEHYNRFGKLLIFQDVTEKENLKIELAKKQKLANLGQFSAIVAHEIKNPLGAIKGSIQIIKKQLTDNKLLDIVEREINKLDMILNNLLYFGKPAKKEKELIYVNDFIENFISYFKINEIFDELKFVLKLNNNFKLLITELELRQIFWNLIMNSYEVKYDATIVIETFRDENYNYLVYYDDGPGINSSIIDDVLKPFYTTKRTGSGLGLYIIKEICENNDILFKLYSNDEFNGFKIEFKIAKNT